MPCAVVPGGTVRLVLFPTTVVTVRDTDALMCAWTLMNTGPSSPSASALTSTSSLVLTVVAVVDVKVAVSGPFVVFWSCTWSMAFHAWPWSESRS